MADSPTPPSPAPTRQILDLLARGAHAEAERAAAKAREQHPGDAELVRLHGLTLQQLQRIDEALETLRVAARMAPQNADVQCTLASAELSVGEADNAIERLLAALQTTPNHPAMLLYLGNAYMATARYRQARDTYAKATHHAPDHAGLRLNLAAAELELGNHDVAGKHAQESLQLHTRFAGAHALLALVRQAQGRPLDAAQSWAKAEQLAPQMTQYPFYAGQMLAEAGKFGPATEAYARALQRFPKHTPALSQLLFTHRHLCDWHELDQLTERLRLAIDADDGAINPFTLLAENAGAAVQHRVARARAAVIARQMEPLRQQLAFNHVRRSPDVPLRVGFVSDGFGEHTIGLSIVSMIEALAQSDLELHLFATAPDDDSTIRRRLAVVTTLHELAGRTHEQVARRIHESSIEILFDLNSYAGRPNAELMALGPAPVQVGWLGYAGTSGAPWMHYLLADRVTVPDSMLEHISEKLLRLPRCHQPGDHTRVIPAPPSRSECGLPAQGTVFACFNHTYKINPTAFARMMLILRRVPGSVLWLPSGVEGAADRLRAAAAAAGITPARLVFLPPLPHEQYLARYAHVDLFLDTLPYGAQNFALDALWANCPVLTCSGDTLSGRVATSLLHHAGLPELACEDPVTFITMAVQLGNDRQALATLRNHLAQQRARNPLFDMKGFATDFRRAVRAMSARYRIGRKPIHLDI